MKLGWSQHRTETESEDLGFGLRLSKGEKFTHWPHQCYHARQLHVYESEQGTNLFTGENIKARQAAKTSLPGSLKLLVKLREFISRPYPQLNNTGLLCCFSKIRVSFKPMWARNTFSVKPLQSVCAIYTLTKSLLPPDNRPAFRLKGTTCRIYWILSVYYCIGNMCGCLSCVTAHKVNNCY